MQGVVTLDRELRIESPLRREEVARFRGIARRAELERDPVYRRLRDEVEAVTTGLEYGRPAAAAPRPPRRALRALTWNIERGNRLDTVKAYLAASPELRAADVVLLNEVDIGMARSGNRNVARELADLLGFEYAFGNSYLCLMHGDVRDGEGLGDNEVGLHGNAILSRFPMRRAENVSIAVSKDKFESSDKRLGHKKALWAELDTPLGPLVAGAVHLDPYASPEVRAAQMADVLGVLDARGVTAPVLLGGDWNTNTYDLQTLPRLAWSIARKLFRGGFAHAIDHYMRPHHVYERGVFDALRGRGFDVEPFNDMAAGSVRFEVGTFDGDSKIKEHLPAFAVDVLRYGLRPWGGVVPLKVDWFAGKGITPLGAGELREEDGRASAAPMIFERSRHEGQVMSDHDPVLVDFVFAP